jgi:Uma2 family endonuclease
MKTEQLMTAEEFFDWVHRPENDGKHFELERGRAVEVPRPGERHGVVAANLAYILGNHSRQLNRGYLCSHQTGVVWEREPDTVRGPDLFYHAESREYDQLHPKYNDRVPELVVEVLSPTDRPGKVNQRIAQYLGWGVKLVWLVDPEDRSVSVYRPDRPFRLLRAEEELDGEDVLPGFRCRLAELFWMPGQKKDRA